jgi:hypothetical protein
MIASLLHRFLGFGNEAGDFHEDWSGTIECRFSTPKARLFLDRLSAIS